MSGDYERDENEEDDLKATASSRAPSSSASLSAAKLGELRRALSGLSSEVRSQQRRAFKPEKESKGGAAWSSLFDELRSLVGTLGMVEREPVVDDFGMQRDFVERVGPLFDFLYDRYWRVTLRGEERIPYKGPAVFVANRSGVLPWDGMMLAHAIAKSSSQIGRPRFLVQDAVLRLPFAQAQLSRVGGVRACAENLGPLLARGHSAVAFPEATRGALHSFRGRYQVQSFAGSDAIRLAVEAGVPIVPVGIVGAEEAYPRLGDSSTLRKFASREIRLPQLPITPTFPMLGPLGLLPLPSKWVIEIGEPVFARDFPLEDETASLGAPKLGDALQAEVQRLVELALDARPATWL
ncbi:MAG: 1-acyl-sn-glycerol-3-phosphate acyltransferase [Myxococcota bacterium]|jgi:1-acyl-sn-glycerol-3-phosphate acyltransferase